MKLTTLSCSDAPVADLSPLRGMPLTSLYCSNTQVSDLSHLQGMPLKVLHCQLTKVSDLSPIQECKSLITLEIKSTKVTAAGVAALRKALPNCKIEWDGPTETAPTDGWIPLFNGRDLTGWTKAGKGSGKWQVVGGVLSSTPGSGECYLSTERDDFADFHLRVEAKVDDGGNGGVLFRCQKNAPIVWQAGYEAQINSTQSDSQKTGSLYNLAKVTDRLVPPDTWFTLEVIAEGKHLRILVDGKQAVDYTDPGPKWSRGAIALQEFAKQTYFRKIEIKPLPEANGGKPGADEAANVDGVVFPIVGNPEMQWKFARNTGWNKGPNRKGIWRLGAASMSTTDRIKLLIAQPGSDLITDRLADDIYTVQQFGDVRVELEFMIPAKSNSGVFLMGEYELNIADSASCGIMGGPGPKVRADKPAGAWQSLDITFRRPGSIPPERKRKMLDSNACCSTAR